MGMDENVDTVRKLHFKRRKLINKIDKNTLNLSKSKQRGITLIALVITIIILLTLAGIVISTLSGKNGILIRTNDAKIRYTNRNNKRTSKDRYFGRTIK